MLRWSKTEMLFWDKHVLRWTDIFPLLWAILPLSIVFFKVVHKGDLLEKGTKAINTKEAIIII
jgi:hypothetical protein